MSKVLVTGATGFVGQHISKGLSDKGHQLYVVSRNKQKVKNTIQYPAEIVEGDLSQGPISIPDVDAIVHLLGEPVFGRWNDEKKKRIYQSRVLGTRNLAASIKNKETFLLAASAMGYYPANNEDHTEYAEPGSDFLAKVCIDWEREIKAATKRTAIFRISMVLGKEGGALEKMLPPFKMGVGGPLGTGEQWVSWVHVDDLARMFVWAFENNKTGVFNASAPEPVTNRDFSRTLATLLHRPLGPRVPRFVLKTMFGEAADVMLASQRSIPQNLLKEGYRFQYPSLEIALKNLI
jgi:hypothetical protein